MNRKHKLIFISLCLLPFALAMSFRAIDNYQFALEKHKMYKLSPDYYPSLPGQEELQPDLEFTINEPGLKRDSTEGLTNESQPTLD